MIESSFTYSEVRTDILRTLRGEHSQQDLSHDLGFGFNQVHKWESGTKRVLWPEFVELCKLKQIPVLENLQKVFCYQGEDPADSQELMFCLKQFFAHLSIDGLAKEMNVHPSMLRRWLGGRVVPDLDTILSIMGLRPSLLESFLTNMFPDRELSSLGDSMARYRNQKMMESQLPVAPAIEAVFSTEDYIAQEKHSSGWVAQKIGASVDVVEAAIPIMLKAGTIERDGDKYAVTYRRIDMHGLDQKDMLKLACYWSLRAANRFAVERPQPPSTDPHKVANLLGYRIVPMSKESAKKVTGCLIKCSEDILSIVESNKEPLTEARVVLMHHFAVADTPLPSDLTAIGRDLTQIIATLERPQA